MRIIDKKTAWEGEFLRTCILTYLGHDGVPRKWEAYDRPGIEGIVIVVPITEKGNVVFISQYRPAVDAEVIELPAGLNDQGEAAEECARRELLEESGYSGGRIELIFRGPSAPATSASVLDVFMATDLRFTGKSGGDANENIQSMEVPLEEAVDYLLDASKQGRQVDMKIIGLVELARRKLRPPKKNGISA